MATGQPKKKMKKRTKIILSIIAVVIVLGGGLAFTSYAFNTAFWDKGNNMAECYLENVKPLTSSPLQGKNIIFLGSSVTYGFFSGGVSFVDYIGKRNNCSYIKEAVSGTTLVDDSGDSYVSRIKKINPSVVANGFVCQLSTNDATQKKELGTVSDSYNLNDFDTKTVAGAMEYIICYARQTWKCPVVFYTGTKYDSEHYAKMVDLLLQIQKKWDIGVIDLWNDPEMNAVSAEDYDLYMYDGIHPSKAGHLLWWTPKFEAYLYDYLK